MAVAVPGEEDRVAAGDLAEQQRRRRLAVRRAHDLAVGDRQVDSRVRPLPPMIASMKWPSDGSASRRRAATIRACGGIAKAPGAIAGRA